MENYSKKLVTYLKSNAEEQKKKILHSVESYKKCLEILKGIKRIHKKDGGDYENTLRNFQMPEGAVIYWELIVFHNELRISAYPEKIYLNGYETDEEKVKAKKEKEPREICGGGYLKEWYYKNADEIEEEIKETIKKYEGRLEEAENNAKQRDAEIKELGKLTEKIGEFLDNIQSENDYKLRDILKNAL